MAFDDDKPDEEVRGLLEVEAREIVRHIRAGTVAYDTEDYATSAVMTLISKREFQVTRHLARLFAIKILEYPQDEELWAQYLVAELAKSFASLMQSYGEVEA